jgi:DNA-binding GntR family transcriptional regulator
MINVEAHQGELDSIDRESFEPAYLQLANIIRRQIASGTFRPGDQLPSESQLCRSYGVSPMTVRRSINLLADQDVVSTAQGRGTFVKPLELSHASFDLRQLHDLFNGERQTLVKLLDARIVSADDRSARKLGIDLGDSVIYIRRLLTQDGVSIAYHRAYLVYDPALPIVEAEMDVVSLQGLLANGNNTLVKHGTLSIEAILLNEEEARLLQTPLPQAGLYLEHLFYDFEGGPISWGWFIFPNRQLRLTTKVGIDLP